MRSLPTGDTQLCTRQNVVGLSLEEDCYLAVSVVAVAVNINKKNDGNGRTASRPKGSPD